MPEVVVTGLSGEAVDELAKLAADRGTTVDALVRGLVERELRRRRGRTAASLSLLFGPIVVLVALILFGD